MPEAIKGQSKATTDKREYHFGTECNDDNNKNEEDEKM